MALCINCVRMADWVFTSTGINQRFYCDGHLPHAYRGTSAVKPAPADVPTPAPTLSLDEVTEAQEQTAE